MTDINYEISYATAEMLPQIAVLEEMDFSFPMTLDMLCHLLEDKTSIFIAAVEQNQVLGYASLKYVYDEGFFNNIAVREAFRGQGIGGSILRKLLDLSKESGVHTVSLEVRENNIPAIDLYKKNGFVIVGNIKNYYTKPKDNAIIMRTSF